MEGEGAYLKSLHQVHMYVLEYQGMQRGECTIAQVMRLLLVSELSKEP